MSEYEDKIKISFDTNAEQTKQQVDGVAKAVNKTTDAVEQQEKAQVSLRQQLRNANMELQNTINKYGETSKEAIASAKAVANLKDQMEFAQQLSKSFNPDQKFKALTSASQLAGTGLQGVTSGMALFGDQSKDTQAQLLKVQAAMAFSDAISNLSNVADQANVLKTNLKDLWKVLITEKVKDTAVTATNTTATATNTATQVASTVAIATETGVKKTATITTTALTVATNLFNLATKALFTPLTGVILVISALILGIGYLIGAWGDFSGEALKAEVANKKLSNSIDAQVKANKKSEEQMELSRQSTLGMAKASGKSEAEIRKLEKALIEQEVAEKRLNAVKLYSIAVEARRVAMTEDATEAQKATAKKSIEAFNDANAKLKEAYIERQKLGINHKIAVQQEETNSNQKLAEKQKEATEKRLQKQKEENEKTERLAKEKKDKILSKEAELQKQLEDLEDKTEQQKLDRQKQRDLKELELLGATGKQKQDLLLNLDKIYIEKQNELNAKIEAEDKDKRKTKFEDQLNDLKNKEQAETDYKNAKNQEEADAILNDAILFIEKTKEAEELKAEELGGTDEEKRIRKDELSKEFNVLKEEEEKRHGESILNVEKNIAEQKQQIQEAGFRAADSASNFLSQVSGKNKAIQKAAIVTEGAIGIGKAVVSNNTANAGALATPQAIATSGTAAAPVIAFNNISTGLNIASIIAGTNKALQSLGGGGSVSGGGATAQAPQGVSAQPQVGVQASSENQIATSIQQSQIEQPPIKAYVVSTDVSTAQVLDAKLISENSF